MHRLFGGTTGSRRSLLPALAALTLLVSACGAASDRSPDPAASQAPDTLPSASVDPATTPGLSLDPGPGVQPTVPAATTGPGGTPAPTADRTGGGSAAASCSGSPENRDFYLAVAEAVDWTVLCPVLPDGWFVESGTYRLAGGGWLEIAYRGPAGARLRLREGAFCPETSGCVPAGTEIADVSVGTLAGRLIATGDGGWAVVVDRGAQRSWLLEGAGLDEATFRSVVAQLVVVDA